MKKNLSETYRNWRLASEEMLEDGYTGSLDCGEQKVREDFSRFAELKTEITFEQMLELEKEYENFGSVEFEGKTYKLTENAYSDNYGTDGGIRYYASATDGKGNEYKVAWDTTAEWDQANEQYKQTGEYSPLLDDESNACDWDTPAEVIEL